MLLAALDKKLDVPHRGVVPRMKRGFTALPNELVVLIFEFATSCDVDVKRVSLRELLKADICNPGYLASVNKHFRQIVLSSPKLWTCLHSSQNAYAVREHLKRSKECDLTILLSLNEHEYEDRWKDFMSLALTGQRRWRRLVVTAFDGNADYHWAVIKQSYPKLSLPRLLSLTLGLDEETILESDGSASDEDGMPTEKYHFYSQWTMPNLESLNLDCIVPAVGAFASLNSVSSCNVRVTSETFDLSNLLRCLESLSHLKTLGVFFDDAEDVEVEDLPSVESRLHSLHVTVHDSPHGLYSGFMRSLRTPYLSDLSVSICLDESSGACDWVEQEGERLFDWVSDLLPGGQSYPCLKCLKLDIRSSPYSIDLSPIFDCAKNLELLDIVAPNFGLDRRFYNEVPRGLHTLRFTDFDYLDDSALEALATEIVKASGPRGLRRLDIHRCRSLTRNAVHSRFPNARIHRT